MNKSEVPKPCPWRHKGEPKVIRVSKVTGDLFHTNALARQTPHLYYVQCVNVQCVVRPRTDKYETRAEAIAAWNDRITT